MVVAVTLYVHVDECNTRTARPAPHERVVAMIILFDEIVCK